MILGPLLFTGFGLYLNSIQVVKPVTRSIVLDNNTYDKDDSRLAVHFTSATGSNMKFKSYDEPAFLTSFDGSDDDYFDDSADDSSFNYPAFVNELSELTEVNVYNGSFVSLLNISAHLAAINVKSFTARKFFSVLFHGFGLR